jgi:hypothetical protein
MAVKKSGLLMIIRRRSKKSLENSNGANEHTMEANRRQAHDKEERSAYGGRTVYSMEYDS